MTGKTLGHYRIVGRMDAGRVIVAHSSEGT